MNRPSSDREAIDLAVTEALLSELAGRHLMLSPTAFSEAHEHATNDGTDLLSAFVYRCYPMSEYDTQNLTLEFDSDRTETRILSTLAFGAATARLLMQPGHHSARSADIALLSAIFNLGIGLVDGICDENRDVGVALLEMLHRADIDQAAHHSRVRGWLKGHLTPELESDPGVVFGLDVIETFFATLHAHRPDIFDLRRRLGSQLAAALNAERRSLSALRDHTAPHELTEISYATSVLPFGIIATLAQSERADAAARHIGEAMWRIDDLVDLVDDAHSGALNHVLVAADGYQPGGLERLVASDLIAAVAGDAVNSLADGIEVAGSLAADDANRFVHFVIRYAGITPA